MNTQFAAINARLDRIEDRLDDRIEGRLDRLNETLVDQNQRLAALEARQGQQG